jgi:hypothetical protein
MHQSGVDMIKGLLVGVIVLLVATFPATWLLMLFLGNLGTGLSYWGSLPLGILVSVLLAQVAAPPLTVIERR